jgi:hypothetical protein
MASKGRRLLFRVETVFGKDECAVVCPPVFEFPIIHEKGLLVLTLSISRQKIFRRSDGTPNTIHKTPLEVQSAHFEVFHHVQHR